MESLINKSFLIPIGIVWLIGCYVAASAGRTRGLGFFEVFLIGLVLSPLTGLLYVIATVDLKEVEFRDKVITYFSLQQKEHEVGALLSTEGRARLKELEMDMMAEKITVGEFYREKSKLK